MGFIFLRYTTSVLFLHFSFCILHLFSGARCVVKISVVIPTLNAAGTLPALLDALATQVPAPPDEIILVDSLSTDATRRIALARANVRIVPIARFSHGGARNLGAQEAAGDIIVLLTQDALPADNRWLAELLAPLADPKVAAVYSRQVPQPDAPPTEKFFLQYHFPPGPPVRRAMPRDRDAGKLTLPDVFFSNVSAAVRRAVLRRYPYDETLIMSEDLKLAVELLRAGHGIAYAAEAAVVHSHHYRLPHLFRRYFDSVVAIREIFAGERGNRASSMGLRYLRAEFPWLLRNHPAYLPRYALELTTKVLATLLARHADRLPLWLLRRASLHPGHWGRRPSAVPPA